MSLHANRETTGPSFATAETISLPSTRPTAVAVGPSAGKIGPLVTWIDASMGIDAGETCM
jgi:hypothetical protein